MTVTNPFMSEQIDRLIHKERVTIEEGDLVLDFAWTLSYFGWTKKTDSRAKI